MFKKLKLKFILTNVLTSTAVILIAFSSIYLVAQNTTGHRPIKPAFEAQEQNSQNSQGSQTSYEHFNQEMEQRIDDERKASLTSLLISLIVTGISVEIIILLISIFLAEQSVKPVKEAYEAQKDFIANASHEIKTPLAVIQANLEAADIKDNKWLNNVAKKAEDLAELNNQLLALARSESVSEDIKLTEFDLNKIVLSAIDAFEPKAEEQSKTITYSSCVKNNGKVKLNKQAFEQILNIYIDNAIKYGKNTIGINIKKDQISVISDGKPIPESKLPHLFDRFYQTDKSSDGVGLGLAIAKSLAEKNGWKVGAYVDKDYKTNIFTLKFK